MQVEARIAELVKKNKKAEIGDNTKTWHTLQPLHDVHFNGDYGTFDLPVANKSTLYGLLAVAVFLLVLGCINFINLTTAQASQRSKEIGIRKTLGSSRKQLVSQFLGETFLLAFLATILSVALTPLILKVFSGFVPDGLRLNVQSQPIIILFLLILIVAVTLLAGFYPSLVLSRFKPVTVLKPGKCKHGQNPECMAKKIINRLAIRYCTSFHNGYNAGEQADLLFAEQRHGF